MKTETFESKDFLLTNKPAGFSTHRPDQGRVGYVEILSEKRNIPLYVVHRLDKNTSGALLIAKSSAAADQAARLFENRTVEKNYLFITDRPVHWSNEHRHSHIRKTSQGWESRNDLLLNAETSFEVLARHEHWTLVKANPLSGRTHQIRLHAADLGIPILGDAEYSGSRFPVLCLHSESLVSKDSSCPFEIQSRPPSFFLQLGELRNPEACALEMALWNRWGLGFDQGPHEAFRISHTEVNNIRVDKLGSVLWAQWYKPTPPDLAFIQMVQSLSEKVRTPHWMIRWMTDRGQNPYRKETWQSGEVPETWIVQENGLLFELRKSAGLSYGLFLDQRANRNWVMRNSSRLSVLNLFSYTGGFSVAAASGGASEVVSIDTSAVYLDWSKRNFDLNGLTTESPVEFHRADARFFVERAQRRERLFDLIILDPPSFGRGPEGVFRIEEDLCKLIRSCFQCLRPRGHILVTCNFEGWTQAQFEGLLQRELPPEVSIFSPPEPDWDFERPGEDRILKGCILSHGPR